MDEIIGIQKVYGKKGKSTFEITIKCVGPEGMALDLNVGDTIDLEKPEKVEASVGESFFGGRSFLCETAKGTSIAKAGIGIDVRTITPDKSVTMNNMSALTSERLEAGKMVHFGFEAVHSSSGLPLGFAVYKKDSVEKGVNENINVGDIVHCPIDQRRVVVMKFLEDGTAVLSDDGIDYGGKPHTASPTTKLHKVIGLFMQPPFNVVIVDGEVVPINLNKDIEIGDIVYHPLDESACMVIDILEGGRFVLTTNGKDKYTTRKSTKLKTIPTKRPSPLMSMYEELAFGTHFYPRSKKINPVCILTGL